MLLPLKSTSTLGVKTVFSVKAVGEIKFIRQINSEIRHYFEHI